MHSPLSTINYSYSPSGLRPNIARRVRLRKTSAATKTLTTAIALTGFLNKGARGEAALKKTPRIIPITNRGHCETVFIRLSMSSNLSTAYMIHLREF
jgi:hypothetical protein